MSSKILFGQEAFTNGLKRIFTRTDKTPIYGPRLFEVAETYQINTPLRLAHWLAQLGHESGELRYTEELASGKAYEGRKDLGNIEPGDGVRFKGRGLIQLTGRRNYTKYFQHLGRDLEPELLTEPELATDSAGWFWATNGLSPLADKDNILAVTRRINGGINGLADRKRLFDLAFDEVRFLSATAVQATLNRIGGFGKAWPELKEDGRIGPRTRSILREMQASFLLKVSGEIDHPTLTQLKKFA